MRNQVTDATPGSVPTSELLAQTLSDARELVRLEVHMARAELKEELVRTKRAAVVGAAGAVSVILALTALLVAVIFALGGTAVTAVIVAAVLTGLGAASFVLAYMFVPKEVLGHTREHLKRDVEGLKEHVA